MTRPRIQIFYDGECGWCRAGSNRLRRLDWLGRFEIIDFTSLTPEERPVEFATFDQGMPVRTRAGEILIGFDGLRHAFIHTPLGWLIGWILYLPGISHLGRRIYRRIADHRPRDERCELKTDAASGE